jgi:putative oxidoreductase
MGVAIWTHSSRGDPFVGRGGSWELAAVYLCVALLLLTSGAGGYSLDALLFRERHPWRLPRIPKV